MIEFVVSALNDVRFHPSSRRTGQRARTILGRGVKIGPRCTLDVQGSGLLEIGERCWLYQDIEIRTNSRIGLGRRTTLQKGVTLNGRIDIGADCIFAPNVFVSSGSHIHDLWPALPIRIQESRFENDPPPVLPAGWLPDSPVEIQDDCWIGVNSVIMRGVRIGRGAIVGANSVVTRDVLPYQIVAGIPAKAIRQRFPWSPSLPIDACKTDAIPYLCSGFDLTIKGSSVDAAIVAPATIAVPLDASGVLCIVLVSPARGKLSIGGESLTFEQGENQLSFNNWLDVSTEWADARLVGLQVDSDAVVKLVKVLIISPDAQQ